MVDQFHHSGPEVREAIMVVGAHRGRNCLPTWQLERQEKRKKGRNRGRAKDKM